MDPSSGLLPPHLQDELEDDSHFQHNNFSHSDIEPAIETTNTPQNVTETGPIGGSRRMNGEFLAHIHHSKSKKMSTAEKIASMPDSSSETKLDSPVESLSIGTLDDGISEAESEGKYYLVDAGYPKTSGFLAPYRGQKYHMPDFQHAYVYNNHYEAFNHIKLLSCQLQWRFTISFLRQTWRTMIF